MIYQKFYRHKLSKNLESTIQIQKQNDDVNNEVKQYLKVTKDRYK